MQKERQKTKARQAGVEPRTLSTEEGYLLKKGMCLNVQTSHMGFSMTVLKCHTIQPKRQKSHLRPVQIEKAKEKASNVGLEPGTWAYRVERSTAEQKNGDVKK